MNKSLILLLCKEKNQNIINFENILIQQKIEFRIICDLCTLNQDDFLLNIGFYNLTRSEYIKKPSAWDKAFYTIYDNELHDIYDYFFFIEDDVYSKDYKSIIDFINDTSEYKEDLITKCVRPKSHYPIWKHWFENYIKNLKYPSQSFNPLCRLSKVLVEKIIQYKKNNGKFNFHEILIASLCLEYNLTYINYIEHEILKKYIGNLNYNPIITIEEIADDLIHHPVKESKDFREKGLCLS
jgi:hypothetical protein